MGGRGSSSGAKGGGDQNLFGKVPVEGIPSSLARSREVLQGVYDVLSDFGLESALTYVYFSDKVNNKELADVNGFNKLTISNSYLKSDGHSDKTVSDGFHASDSFHGTGTHEAGHIVVNTLLKEKVMPDGTPLQQATARKNGKLERAIIKEATKRYGSNPKISEYGSTNLAEKVAEAVSDVYTNKTNANPYSKVIVQVMKDTQSGAFKPKINYDSGIKKW